MHRARKRSNFLMAAKKKKTNTKSAKKTKAWDGFDIAGLVLVALGIIVLISLFTGEESIMKKTVVGTLLGVFGLATYIIPFLLIALGVFFIMVKKPKIHAGKVCMTALFVLALAGSLHIIFYWFNIPVGVYSVKTTATVKCFTFVEALQQGFSAGKLNAGMGAFAAMYVYPLSKLFTCVGAFVALSAIGLIAITVLFNLSLKEAGEKMGRSVKNTGEKMRESINEANIRRREAREKKRNYDYEVGVDEPGEKAVAEKEDDDDFGTEREEYENTVHPFEISEVARKKAKAEETEFETPEILEEEEDSAYAEEDMAQSEPKQTDTYSPPPLSLLNPPAAQKKNAEEDHSAKIEMMESTLRSFGINAWVENITVGPAITRYELSIERGTRVSKILNLADDIALSMAAVGVRIEAPIPGKSAIGIEIPNEKVSMVTLREVLETDAFKNHKSPVAVGLGKDITGTAIIADLAKMPHLLIAGQTGAGKSVCINAIIMSLLFKSSPKDVKLILVDPKKVELNMYDGDPHLLTPVVSDPKKAAGALQFVVREMEKRYETFARKKVKDIVRYNEVAGENGEDTMPRIVVIVDELNDLMLVARGEVEDSVMRIAQLARAAGIYLILATQRPSVNVITGVIKANIPSRIAFAVASGIDSKTILDSPGAEKLVGKGDMLFHANGEPKPKRVQGAFVGEQEVEKVVEYIKKKNAEAKYIGEEQLVMREIKPNHGGSGENPNDGEDSAAEDELFPAAVEYAIECGNISISALQRRFKVGYARAGRLIDDMELRGVVEPSQGSKARQVLMTREQFWAMYDERLD